MCCLSVLMSWGLDSFLTSPNLRAFASLFAASFCLCCRLLDLGFVSFGKCFVLWGVLRIAHARTFRQGFRRLVRLLELLLEMRLICLRCAFLDCVFCLCIGQSHIVYMDCGRRCYRLHLLLGRIFYDFLKICHAFIDLLKMKGILKM